MGDKTGDQWPVIVHQSLEGSDISRRLLQAQHKVRVSGTTVENTVIFPLSSTAFMVVSLSQHTALQQLLHNVERLVHVHARCYLVTVAPLYGTRELQMLSHIQMGFIESKLQTIPVHNNGEAVQAMTSIAKVLCKPASKIVYNRLETLTAQHKSSDVMATVLQQVGLDKHQIQVVQDRLGSLACLVTADCNDLLDCSLDKQAVNKILTFFGNN